MADQTHAIQTQLLLLEMDAEAGQEDYQALLQTLTDLADTRLAAIICDCLDQHSNTTSVQHIERLEIHVTLEENEEWSKSLCEQLPEALRQALQEQLPQENQIGKEESAASSGLGETVKQLEFNASSQERGWLNAGAKKAIKSKDLLPYYLLTGRLAWFGADDFTAADWAKILASYGLGKGNTSKITRQKQDMLRQLLIDHPQALERFQRDFSARRLAQLWLGQEASPAAIKKLQHQLAKLERAQQQKHLKQLLGKDSEQHTKEAETEAQANLLERRFLRGVGLLLLHPFLEDYLLRAGVVEAGLVLDFDRAASLLAALVLGRSPVGEWELEMALLLLPKTEKRVVGPVQLTAEELVLTHKTIENAISAWPTIGETSVSGFRESFLQRTGFLEQGNYGGIITWESRPFDMLLDYLPWRLSYIRLAWMDSFLTLNTGR